MGDFLAYELLPVILNMTLTGSVVIVFVLLARLALRRAPRVCSYALWLVVLFRLLCPVSVTANISLMGLLDTPVTEVTAHTSAAAYVPSDVVHSPEPTVTLPVPGVGETVTEALPKGEEQTVADPLEAPMAIATIIWMAGVATMVICGVVSLLRLRRRLVGAVMLEKGVYLADHISTPFVLGLVRPKIYLPSALPEGERGYILLHERHHIRRLDHAVKLLAFLALCVHWFNPLVWLMFVLLGRDMEMSCDEAVMRKLGETVRADYSASLLRLATGRKIIAGAPLAFGEGDTRDRVVNVLKWKRPRLWAVLAGAAACAAVIVACAVNPGVRTAGQYASMEDYIQQQMELKKRDVYHSGSGLLRDMEEGETVSVTDARASQVEKQGELEDLAPEGTLEAWTYQYRVRLDAPEENVLLLGNQTVEDGWYDLEGRGEHHVAALRYPDGSYDILYDDPANEDRTFYNGDYDSWEEALFDWYVRQQGLDLPPYVEDWRDRLDLPDGDGWERYPVHRYDGDGWYLYVPLSTWDNVSPSDTGGAWIWGNVCGIGWVAVQRFNQPLSVRQALARDLGLTPVDSTEQIWQSGDEFIRCLYDDPGGGSWQVDADWSGADSSDSPYARMVPRVMALIAESFTLDERITATVKPRLTLAAVQELAERKGELLSWTDFEDYTYTETGSGLYIRDYPIDGSFSLRIGGGWLDEEPMYIYLNCGEDFIDIRREDVDAFIRNHLPGGGADGTGSMKVSLTEGGRFSPTKAEWFPNGDAQEVTTADIAETLAAQTLPDGTEVLFYTSTSGDKYCAYIPVGTERLIRFTCEENGYTSGYGISLYENVFGRSGFRIECPRGAAYYANDYYYFDEDGTLWQLADCGSEALEVDLNGDGQKELLWSYHGYELYYDTMIGGQLYEADLCDLTAQALGYRRGNNIRITLEVPEHAEDFADGETGYALVLPEEGSDTAGERLSGTIRLTVNTLEVVPGNR